MLHVITVNVEDGVKYFTQEVKVTRAFYKPENPDTAPFGKTQFRKEDEYHVKNFNSKTIGVFGRDFEETVKSFCEAMLPEKVAQEFIRQNVPATSAQENTEEVVPTTSPMPELPTEPVEADELPPISADDLSDIEAEENEVQNISTEESTSKLDSASEYDEPQVRKSNSTIAVPPGATIEDQLHIRNLTLQDFASQMGVSEDYAKDLINGNVPLTQEIADLLGMTFGIPAGFWLNLEASYRNQLTKVATENSMENQSETPGDEPIDDLDDWLDDTTLCECCHKSMPIDAPVVVVNENIQGERYECSDCHDRNMADGTEIQCPTCEGIFDKTLIRDNRCPGCNAFIAPKLVKHYEPTNFPATGDILIHTDGSCLTNPGTGGWAAVIQCGQTTIELSGSSYETTNQVMELTAPYQALCKLEELGVGRDRNVKIVSDSKYVVNGIYGTNGKDAWYLNWRKNGWHNSGGTVKNLEYWMNLISLFEARKPHIKAVWVKGHAGNPMNERCDYLASQAAQKAFNRIMD